MTTLMAEALTNALAEQDRRRPPDGLERYASAPAAWHIWHALHDRRRHAAPGFMPSHADGEPGFEWTGQLADELRRLDRDDRQGATVAGVRRFLAGTGNLIARGGGRWWLRETWLDVSPATLAAHARKLSPVRSLPPAAPDVTDEDPDGEDWGNTDADHVLFTCRFRPCVHTELSDEGRRTHERTAHPDQFWNQTAAICVYCPYPAASEPDMCKHLGVEHRVPEGLRAVVARQAVAKADQIRAEDMARVPEPAPAPVPAVRAAGEPVTLAEAMAAIELIFEAQQLLAQYAAQQQLATA
jgi:hypothetical protein